MPEMFTDAHLDAVLASVGRTLVVPQRALPVDLSDVRARRSITRPVLVAAAMFVVALLVAGALITPAREAVADWLGIGSTRIERVPERVGDPTGLPVLSADAVPSTAVEAQTRLGRRLPVVTDRALGRPELLAVPPEGGVLMAWPAAQTTLWLVPDEGPGRPLVDKLLSFSDRAQPLPGLGEAAVMIEGGHVLETPQRRVAAGRVLLWVEPGIQYRLESDFTARRMTEIAHSIRAG